MDDINVQKELQPTMSNDDVEKVMKFMEENKSTIDSISYNTNEVGESKVAKVSIDPNTGKEIITNTNQIEDDTVEFDKLLEENDINFNIDESPITDDEIKDFIKSAKDNPSIVTGLEESDLSIDDIEILMNLIRKKQNKEDIESPYKQLPESCKVLVNKALGIGSTTVYNKDLNATRNIMAETLLDEFITSITANRAENTINTGIEKLFNKASSEIGDTIVGYTEERNNEYRKYIEENIDDPVKKADALKILDSIDKSYELTEFREFCKTCKIRKIDVEKPTKHHKDMDIIMEKYKNEQKYNIYDIYNTEIVLFRNLNTESETYTNEQVRAFFLAFSKYCRDFKPSNTNEHIFMFYTLYNILLLDVNKGDKAETSQRFLANVKECISSLITRNQFLST